ncbi:Zinc protease [Minicystis rosea]|nr:Zinc protease [Minicystis rosea]
MTNLLSHLRRARRVLTALGLGLGIVAATSAATAQPAKKSKGKRPAAQKQDKGAKAKGGKGAAKAAPSAKAPVAKGATDQGGKRLELTIPVQRLTLENGLRVVINVDHTSPTVAVAVTYDVGSRNEERGRSGFAHLFEHMMFQGSRNVPKGDHFRLVQGHGGTLNGTTNADRTNYFEVLPANEIALGLWLEADRMRSLDISQENFENQRKVVQEEYRMRYSNAAYAMSGLRLDELVYQGHWPYEHSTIGSMADLDGAKLEWVRDFHATHYGPNNAVLAISGDIEPNEAVALVHKYFDSIPKIEVAAFQDAPLPEQTSQRTAVVKDDHARSPSVLYGWAIPPARDADHYALQMAGIILADGESSRLHQLLVRDKSVAQHVSAGARGRRGIDVFHVDAELADGAKIADVERMIETEIKTLATRGPTDAEVEKARRQVEAGLVLGLQSNLSRARRLGEYEVYWGDANLLAGELPRYFAVGKDDIKRVVDKHLGPTRRTLVETVPLDHGDAKEGAGKPAAAKPAAASAKKAGDVAKHKKKK